MTTTCPAISSVRREWSSGGEVCEELTPWWSTLAWVILLDRTEKVMSDDCWIVNSQATEKPFLDLIISEKCWLFFPSMYDSENATVLFVQHNGKLLCFWHVHCNFPILWTFYKQMSDQWQTLLFAALLARVTQKCNLPQQIREQLSHRRVKWSVSQTSGFS